MVLAATFCSQEQLEHAEVSTALRYLGQYYFKNKLYDEASLCAQRCCDYNDVSHSTILASCSPLWRQCWLKLVAPAGSRRRKGSVEADLTGEGSDRDAVCRSLRSAVKQQHTSEEGVSSQPDLLYSLTFRLFIFLIHFLPSSHLKAILDNIWCIFATSVQTETCYLLGKINKCVKLFLHSHIKYMQTIFYESHFIQTKLAKY